MTENKAQMSSSKETKAINLWFKVLKKAIALPGAKIDRKTFLKKELIKSCPDNQVKIAIESSPSKAGVSNEITSKISKKCIKWHIAQVTTISFATGLPGGWWIAGTIPADLTQYYWHVVQICQKLAYLNGWPDLFGEEDVIDDETLMKMTLFIGAMYTVEAATIALSKLAEKFASQVVKRLPQKALTKYGIYNVSKQVAKWIGIKITKESFAKGTSKVIPIVSGFISAGLTLFTFKPMCNNLRKYLEELPMAN